MPARIYPKNRLWPALAGLLFCLFLASPAWAIDYTWDGLGFPLIGIWATGSNWDPNGVPGAADTIRFDATTNLNPGANRTIAGLYANGANIYFYGGPNVQVGTIWAEVSTTISHTQGGNLITNSGELRYENAGSITVNISSWQPSGNTTLFSAGTLTYSGAISGGTSLTTAGAGTTALTALNTYTGSTTVSAGTLTATGAGNILPSTTTLNIAGGAACNLDDQTLARLSGSGTLNLSGDVNVNEGGTQTFSGNITQAAASTFTMQGSGSLTLTGNVASALAVSNGELLLNGTSNNAINVTGGSRFLGTGSTTGQLTVTNGYLMPGNSIGTFTCGSLTMQAAGTLTIEVNGAAADQLAVTNGVTLNNPTLKLTGTPAMSAAFTIINKGGAAAVAGNFSGLAEGAIWDHDGYRYQITYQGGSGNDVVLTCLGLTPNPTPTPTPTPEPAPEPAPDTPPAPKVPQGSGPSPTGSLDGTAFSWPLVEGATHYRIYRADCPLCPRREIGRTTENSFVDNTAIPGQPYTYWLRAENNDGPGVYSNWMAAWRYEQDPGRAGDFNGDGVADLLWWDRATGQLYIWFMAGGQVMNVSAPMEGLDVSQWLLIGTSDFNGDGVADLLWWKPETGEILFWYMQASMATAGAPFQAMSDPISQTMPAHAAIAYPGDLNGDGFTDILWRDYSNGDVTIWLMGSDGKPSLSGPPTPADDTITKGERPGVSGGLQWQVAGLSDVDGDGKADVIWQDERNNRLVTWFMDGAAITGAVEENKGLEIVWRLPGVGDLNGDRQADIVWRNDASGEVKAWLMQAGVFSEERNILEGSEDATQWQVKAVGDFRAPGSEEVYFKHSESEAAKIVTLDGREFTPTVE